MPGTVSLPAGAIPEGGLLLQTASGAGIVRAGDGTSRAVPGVGAPLDVSPDGSTVLGSTNAGLLAVDVASGEIQLLVGAAGGGDFVSARWSPDGTMVAYTAEGADSPAGGSTLCALTVDPLEQTCFPELGHVCSFDWAPDGERLVVAGPPPDPLRTLDVTTGALVQVTPQEGDTAINDAIHEAGMGTSFQLVDPTWSPSGSYLAALANLRDSKFAYVPVVFTPDGRFVAFGRPSGEYPHLFEWSPTRDVLAYTRGEAPYRITGGYLLDRNRRGGSPRGRRGFRPLHPRRHGLVAERPMAGDRRMGRRRRSAADVAGGAGRTRPHLVPTIPARHDRDRAVPRWLGSEELARDLGPVTDSFRI